MSTTTDAATQVAPVRPTATVCETPDGARLAVFAWSPELLGAGPEPVLLLHGNGSSHHAFWRLAAALAPERCVIAPDMRHQGVSSRGTAPLTYELLADDAVRALDALGAGRAVVVGHSDGGIEALLMARDHADRVAGILAMGANLTPDGLSGEDLAGMEADEELYRSLADRLPKAASQAELTRLMLDHPHIDPASLAAISCPATVMAGEFDMIAEEETRAIRAAVPGARLAIAEGAGHSLMREAPEAVEAETRALLARVEGA